MSILDFAASQGWAMLPERVEEIAAIVAREHEVSPEALEAYRAKTMDKAERAKIRDGVAILYVEGPLFKKANLFVEFSGATSYQILRRDLQAALDDPKVHSILLSVDSPGGEANGCDELAAAIFEARSQKPVTAYVSGMAASGGYWIASAATKIVISDAAMLGSIGVVLGIQDKKAADERRGVKTIEFVSSQSPGKRPDPSTDDGRNRIQAMVDDLADVFIASVAKYRGVSAEKVVSKFGAGGMLVGAKAVASGMADEVGQMETVIASMISSGLKRQFLPRSAGGFSMSENNTSPTAEELAEKAAAAAQERIGAIISSDLGKQFQPLAHHLAFKTKISATDSAAIIAAAKESMSKVEDRPAQVDPEQAGATANASRPGDYVTHKQHAGALGLAEPPAAMASAEKTKATWATAVKSVNGRIN